MVQERSFLRIASSRWLAPGLGSLLGLAAVGCAGRPLAVSPGLAEKATPFYAQKLDRKSIDFGDYQVREIRRGWQHSGTASVGPLSASAKSRDFSFTITHAGLSMQVKCGLSGTSAGVAGLAVKDDEEVGCTLNPSDASAPWNVALVRRGNAGVQGKLQQGERVLQIAPAHGSGHRRVRGYLIREEGDIAAADVGKKTRTMWLPKAGEGKDQLAIAGAAMALILHEELTAASRPRGPSFL